MHMHKAVRKLLLAVGALALCSSAAVADIYLNQARTSSWINNTGNWNFVPITNAANSTTWTFYANRSKTVLIAYSAECTVQARDWNNWLNIDVILNGTVITPSSSDNAFCTSHGTNRLDGWTSVVVNGYGNLQPGLNRVQVRARHVGWQAGDRYRLDDTHLGIWD